MENPVASADASQSNDTFSTVTDRRKDISEAVELLALKKELAEAIVDLTMQRLSEAEAMGRLSGRDQRRLAEKYSSDLVRVTQDLQKHEQLLTLHELEDTQHRLIHGFKEQLQDINQQILRLKDEAPSSNLDVLDGTEQVEVTLSPSPVPNAHEIAPDDMNLIAPEPRSPERDHAGSKASPARKMSSSKVGSILLLITVAVFLVSSASYTMGLLSANNLSNTGTLITPSDHLGVYGDRSCTQRLTAIDWGVLASGEQKTSTVFVCNSGNASFVLQLEVLNWDPPSLSDQILVSWDYRGQVLAVDDILQVTFVIAVSPDLETVGAFSYDLVVTTYS